MIYFDEAGYTGADLTNKAHPFFTLASTNVTAEEISAIKEAIEYDSWGGELHFSRMYTNYQGRSVLDKLFAHPLMTNEHILLAFANKRYCIYARIVDILIETYFHHQGVNLYKGGQALLIANYMYYGAIVQPNQVLVEGFEENFVKMIRNPSVESVADFYRTTDKLRFDKDSNEMLRDMLSLIPPTIQCIREISELGSLYLDMTAPLFVESVEKWYELTGVRHDVIYDKSEPIYASKDWLEAARDMNHEETLVGYGERKHTYPLPVGELTRADSRDEFGIQIADVYASALNFVLTPRTDKYVKYQNQLKMLPIFQTVGINVAPATSDFLQKRSQDVKGVDPLDFLCEYAKTKAN